MTRHRFITDMELLTPLITKWTTSHHNRILEALRAAARSLDLDVIVSETASQTKLPEKQLEATFIFFQQAFTRSQAGPDSLDSVVRDGVTGLADLLEKKVTEKRVAGIVDFAQAALGLDTALGMSTKANEVILESEHVFDHSRIITDLRPVFNQADKAPAGSTLVHNLVLTYYQSGVSAGGKKIALTLDSHDLRELQQTIERALAKENVLRKQARKTFKELIS